MKIKFNPLKKYKEYRQTKPIRVKSEEVYKNSCDECPIKDISESIERIANKVSEMTDTFEKHFNVPPRIEKDFGNGMKLLVRRANKEERATTPLAEVVDL